MTKQIDELMDLVADNFQATEYNSYSTFRTALEAALNPGEPVAFVDRAHLKELQSINGMRVWAEGPNMYFPANYCEVPTHLVAVYTAALPAQTGEVAEERGGGLPWTVKCADGKTRLMYPESHHNDWNKQIRDSVDSLLEQAGYDPNSSARHQLAMMNFSEGTNNELNGWQQITTAPKETAVRKQSGVNDE